MVVTLVCGLLQTIVGWQGRRYNVKGKILQRTTVHSTLKQGGCWAIRKIHRHTVVHLHQIFPETKDVLPAWVSVTHWPRHFQGWCYDNGLAAVSKGCTQHVLLHFHGPSFQTGYLQKFDSESIIKSVLRQPQIIIHHDIRIVFYAKDLSK